MDGLKDIKPLVSVPDVSLYYFLALVFGGILLLVLCIFTLSQWLKSRQPSLEKKARECLQQLDYTDAKKAAYTISKWAHYLADTDAKKALHVELIVHLEPYKYKREVPPFSDHDKAKVNAYVEACK